MTLLASDLRHWETSRTFGRSRIGRCSRIIPTSSGVLKTALLAWDGMAILLLSVKETLYSFFDVQGTGNLIREKSKREDFVICHTLVSSA